MRKYLVELRNAHKLSQKEVAQKMLISQNYLSLIELGDRQEDLKLSTLKGFAKVYGVDISSLIEQESAYQKNLNGGNPK